MKNGDFLLKKYDFTIQTDELLATGAVVRGWVNDKQDEWCVQADTVTACNATSRLIPGGTAGADIVVGTMVKYTSSLYLVLNPLENGYTTGEKAFGIYAEMMRDMILGLIASLMTAIQLAMATTDAEVATRLKGLKQWLELKNIPKAQQARTMEFFNELWAQQPVDPQGLFDQMPPNMRLIISTFLYRRFLSSVPLFRTLSDEVIAALCKTVTPLVALKGQEIMKEGTVGTEMYMVMKGEVEVLTGGQRLGFLAEGAFFGEVPVLDYTSGAERRTRTVKSVTETELCFITRAQMDKMKDRYPELRARMNRFSRTGNRSRTTGKLTKKSLKQVGLSRSEMDACVKTYDEIKGAASYVRNEKNWDESQVIPFTMITAAVRMKKRANEARARLLQNKMNKPAGGAKVSFGGLAGGLQPAPPSQPAPVGARRAQVESMETTDSDADSTVSSPLHPAGLEVVVPAPAPAEAPASAPKRAPSSRAGGLDWGELDKPGTPTAHINLTTVVSSSAGDISMVAEKVTSLDYAISTAQSEMKSVIQGQAAEITGLHSKIDQMMEMMRAMQAKSEQDGTGLTLRMP